MALEMVCKSVYVCLCVCVSVVGLPDRVVDGNVTLQTVYLFRLWDT